jgi:peptidyl-prolyl cis-trans isomerase SurA
MKTIIFFKFLILLFLSSQNLQANIYNSILIKVGDNIITSYELKNKIRYLITTAKKEFKQDEINIAKPIAIKSLISKKIKENELKKYNVKGFNKDDLQKTLLNTAKFFQTDVNNLENILSKNNIDYEILKKEIIIDLQWNTLIYSMFKNQLEIDIYEIEQEVNKVLRASSDLEKLNIDEIKKEIINNKKNEKLQLFSRSHFFNVENKTLIKFNE